MGKPKLRKESNFSGGLNTGMSAFALSPHETTDEVGFDFDEYPYAKVRKGRTTYGTSGAATTNLLVNYKATHLIRAVGTVIQYDNAGTWTNRLTGLTSAAWDAVNFRDTLIMTNGTDNVKTYDGTNVTDLNAADAPKGKFITQHDNRVYILKDRTISFCALGLPADWTTVDDAGSINLSTPNGELGTGLKAYKNNVLAFSNNYYAKLFGTGPDDYELIGSSDGIGCCSFKTIQQVGDTLFWMDQRGVYMYNGGAPVKISQKIQSHIDALNTTYLEKNFGGTDGLKYYIGLVTGANTEPNILFVFDPREERYKWRIQSLITDLGYSANFGGRWYNGGSSGKTYLMNDGTTDDGTAVSYMVTTRPFDEGVPEAEKIYMETHLQGVFPSGSTLAVSVSVDDTGSSFTSVDYDPLSTSALALNKNVIIPLDTVPLTHWARFKLNGTGPVTIYNMQRYYKLCKVQI